MAANLKAMPYSLALAGGKALSKNFKVREFACHVWVPDGSVECEQGGSPRSQHKHGRAADISIAGVTPKQIAAYAGTLMPTWGGIGVYPTFCHVDVRAGKSRW